MFDVGSFENIATKAAGVVKKIRRAIMIRLKRIRLNHLLMYLLLMLAQLMSVGWGKGNISGNLDLFRMKSTDGVCACCSKDSYHSALSA